MDIGQYLVRLDAIKYKPLRCQVCGSQALASRDTDAICQFCEAYVPSAANASPQSKKAQTQITKLLKDKKWDDASKLFAQYADTLSDPLTVYGTGIFYWYYSDYLYHSKNYALKGYMEQNSKNVYAALDATVEAKRYLFRSIKMVTDLTAKVSQDETLLYTKFIADIRLRRPYMAVKTLEMLKSAGKNDLILDYATMVYSVVRGDRSAETKLEGLLNTGELNAFYYLAKYLVMSKKLNDAMKVLQKITSMVYMPMAEELIRKIKITQEARSLT